MKKKVLIGYNYILHYRVPLFNLLCEKYDITVIHSGKPMVSEKDLYKEIIVPVYKIGPIYFQPGLIKEVLNPKYNAIVALFDVAWVTTLISIIIRNRKSKFILWGAWMTKNKLANFVRIYFSKKVDANIFYTQQALLDFRKNNVDLQKLFVANNTFDIGEQIHSYNFEIKDRILFVGSLDERKQNTILINAFNNIKLKIPQNIKLVIIGEGSQLHLINNLVKTLSIQDRVEILGKINNVDKLKDHYKSAIVCVSFGQAGLSVLQSLGYGVPFMTKRNAISGGEISNIKNNYNGILCDDNIESLENSILNLCLDLPWARKLGKNAFDYYQCYCTMKNMAQGFIDAIENTRLSVIDTTDI